MEKIYATKEIAQERIDSIEVRDDNDQEITYGMVLCDPKYSKATFIGCTFSILVNLTGINVILLYSCMIFKGLTLSATFITAMIGIVNFLAALIGLTLLYCFGRRTIMLLFNILMALTLLLLSYFSFKKDTIGMIICVLLFICFFQFSTGCVTWLYLAEILQDKAMAIAIALCYFMTLSVSIAIPLLLRRYDIAYIFLFCGVCTVIGSVFIAVFMKETMGKT